jgi:hypothetical protein
MDLNCDGKISRCEMASYGQLNEQVIVNKALLLFVLRICTILKFFGLVLILLKSLLFTFLYMRKL